MATNAQVTNAPNGAAKLKINKWFLTLGFPIPLLNSTDVNPNAAGALWSMIARKIIADKAVFSAVDEAPSAIPSAAE